MTEQAILSLVMERGPWVAMIVMLAYIIANKLGPQWLSAWIEERKTMRKSEMSVYERFIAQQAETLKFIASATEAIHSMSDSFTRALDANTQQVYRLTEAQREGGKCPLPDCPFMEHK